MKKNIVLLLLLFIVSSTFLFTQTDGQVYYVSVNGQQRGPLDFNALMEMVDNGTLTRTSLIWKEGMVNWAEASTVMEISSLFSSLPPPMPKQTVMYQIGDKGPGGGFIFVAEDGTYMEVSAILGEYNWLQAVKVAKDYKGGNFSDWRLPNKAELNLVYQNLRRKNLANLGDYDYWSSSEAYFAAYYGQNFRNGGVFEGSINLICSVRAIRAF